MRGFLLGLVLIPAVVIGLLSIRPGGLRAQLRAVARRLRLALLLGGVYLLVSALVKLMLPRGGEAEAVSAAVGIVLAGAFVLLSQDRQLEP